MNNKDIESVKKMNQIEAKEKLRKYVISGVAIYDLCHHISHRKFTILDKYG